MRQPSNVLRGGRALSAVAGTATLALLLTGCGGVKTTNSSSTSASVVIGASLPLSGDLAGFGAFQKWGYERAVKEVNDAGGVTVAGKKQKVKLVLLDDKTDPNQVSSNTQTLIASNNAVGLLGSCTPALVIPGAVVADRSKVPFVTGCAPVLTFAGAKKWSYAWDLFFAEPDAAAAPFQTLKTSGSSTNKKVAILHDNGPDGQALGGKIWPMLAKVTGYSVVTNQEFPTQNTDFSAAVQKAKASGADVLLVDAGTPQAISIRKQMATAGYTPKVIVMEKGAEPVQFAKALGNLANGVIVGGYWDPSFPYPGAKTLATDYTKETGQGYSQHIADSYTAAKVLLDAISKAGSTDASKLNTAIGATDATYPVGPVKFASNNTATIALAELQWQKGKTIVVWPTASKTGPLLFPVPAS